MKLNILAVLAAAFIISSPAVSQNRNEKTIKKEYWTNGKVRAEITVNADGHWDGTLRTYYPSGAPDAVFNYMPMSTALGAIQTDPNTPFDEKLEQTAPARIGFGIVYYENGGISIIIPYYYGKKHGRALYFYRSGELSQILHYHEGKPVGKVNYAYSGAATFRDEGKTCAVTNPSTGVTYYNPIKKQSVYNSLRTLEAWQTLYPGIIKEKTYWDYIYSGMLIEDFLATENGKTPSWTELVMIKQVFNNMDETKLKMNEEKTLYWEQQREDFRDVIVTKSGEAQIQIHNVPALIDNGLVRELIDGAKQSVDLEAKRKRLIQAQEILEELNQFHLKYIQQDEIDDMLKEIEALLDQGVNVNSLRDALIDYTGKNRTTKLSTDELVEAALNMMESVGEKEAILFINDGLFEYMSERAKITPNDSPKKALYEFQVISWGSLLMRSSASILQMGISLDNITPMFETVSEVYGLRCKVNSTADFTRLRTEFDFKRKGLAK